ncbi:hypothetical protein Mapa_003736 [Marchantia paleacea]|nr:hypothetical protein Mapa_003736 [Marchantia paleacea]
MSSCDCDRKTSNGGNCDSSCKECEPSFSFETSTSSRAFYSPVLVLVASRAAGNAQLSFNNLGHTQ